MRPPEHGRPQHRHKRVSTILAGAGVCELLTRRRSEAERVVEFMVDEQTGVRSDDRNAKLEHQPAVKIEPERLAVRFTQPGSPRHQLSNQLKMLIIVVESRHKCRKSRHYPLYAGWERAAFRFGSKFDR